MANQISYESLLALLISGDVRIIIHLRTTKSGFTIQTSKYCLYMMKNLHLPSSGLARWRKGCTLHLNRSYICQWTHGFNFKQYFHNRCSKHWNFNRRKQCFKINFTNYTNKQKAERQPQMKPSTHGRKCMLPQSHSHVHSLVNNKADSTIQLRIREEYACLKRMYWQFPSWEQNTDLSVLYYVLLLYTARKCRLCYIANDVLNNSTTSTY